MAYDERSAEVMLGNWCENEVARRSISHGWHVLHTSKVGNGATMVQGPDGKVVMPDLQLFDLINGRKSRLVEVKAKSGAYEYKKLGIDCTGIDDPLWESYLRIDQSGVPVDLALIHLHQPYRSSPEIVPTLLWQTVKRLADCEPMRFNHPRFRDGAVVWNIEAFDILGYLPNPPAEIIEAAESIKRHLRIWEKPPQLRRPRVVPGQGELFPPRDEGPRPISEIIGPIVQNVLDHRRKT